MVKDPVGKPFSLTTTTSRGGVVTQTDSMVWRLSVPPGERSQYRLAQMDDYGRTRRRDFPWQPGLTLNLEARVGASSVPGTWGFGLWNDPFALSLGFGGGTRRLPALPNAAWFFYAAPPNHLAFRDDIPAQGFLAQVFRSPLIPSPLLGLGMAGVPVLLWPWMARKLRPFISRIIQGDSCALPVDVTDWHVYTLEWCSERVVFQVDGEMLCETHLSPRGPLGLVLWIDNQYAAYPPDGRISFGTLPASETHWLEIRSLLIDM
jgi:hypothetical protein